MSAILSHPRTRIRLVSSFITDRTDPTAPKRPHVPNEGILVIGRDEVAPGSNTGPVEWVVGRRNKMIAKRKVSGA